MPSDTYTLTISDAGVSTPAPHAASHITGGSDPIPTATSSVSGLMSPAIFNQHTANTAKVGNITHTGDVTDASGVLTVTKINNVRMSSLATGVVKNTTGTGVPSIAVAADFPTLNQNTTGNATTATTATFATNIAAGSAGAMPYQTGFGATALLNAGTAGYVLKSNGSAAPSWAPVDLSSGLTGNVPVASGGTGASTFTEGVVKASGTSSFTTVDAPSGDLVGTTDTQTLTNKTLGSGTTFSSAIGVSSGGTGAAFFNAGILKANAEFAFDTVTAPSGDLVGTTDTQTLTNKTLGSGTVFEGSLSATAISGILPYAKGGTGASSFALVGGIVKAGESSFTSVAAPSGGLVGTTDSQTLTNKTLGSGTVFSGGIVSLTSNVSDVLPVANGGTGATTLTGYVKGTGTTTMTSNATVPVADISGTLPVVNGGTGVILSTGSGSNVLSISPTLSTPFLGIPNSGNLVNCTGLPLSSGVDGVLPASHGGTGHSSYAVGDIIYSSGSTALSKLQSAVSGNVLLSNGQATAPSYGKVGLTTHVTGTLPVANGGTGAATLTGYVKGTGITAMTSNATVPVADISGTLPVANGGTGAATLTGYVKGTGITAMTSNATVPVADISGTLPVANGGTGAATLTGYVKGTGTTAMTSNATVPVADISGTLPVANGGTGASSTSRGQISKLTPSTAVAIPVSGTFYPLTTAGNLDLATSVNTSIGANNTFSIRNASGFTKTYFVAADIAASAGNNETLAIKLFSGTPGGLVAIDESEYRNITTGTQETELSTSWMVTLANAQDVAVYLSNISSTGSVVPVRARLIAIAVI